MQEGPPSDPAAAAATGPQAPAGGDEEREQVAAVLEQLRAGVRQRRAEVATLGGPGLEGAADDLQRRLLLLRHSEYVREPVPTSHRQRVGPWIVLAKKAGYKLFGKWLIRPLVEQQNAFNQATSAALEELVESEERLRRQVGELAARLAALEAASRGGR